MKGKIRTWLQLILITFLFSTINLYAQENGNGGLLLVAEPGFRIYLNEEFIGFTTTEQNGILIKDLKPGNYQLKATKRTYTDFELIAKVISNEITEISLLKKIGSREALGKPQMHLHVVFPSRMKYPNTKIYINGNEVSLSANDHIILTLDYEGRYEYIIEESLAPGYFFTKNGKDIYLKVKLRIDSYSIEEITEYEFEDINSKKQLNTKRTEL